MIHASNILFFFFFFPMDMHIPSIFLFPTEGETFEEKKGALLERMKKLVGRPPLIVVGFFLFFFAAAYGHVEMFRRIWLVFLKVLN